MVKITVSGTPDEIIEFANTLKLGVDAERFNLTPDERDEVNRDNIIAAIKMYRDRSNAGLKESKDFIESTPEGKAFLCRQNIRFSQQTVHNRR